MRGCADRIKVSVPFFVLRRQRFSREGQQPTSPRGSLMDRPRRALAALVLSAAASCVPSLAWAGPVGCEALSALRDKPSDASAILQACVDQAPAGSVLEIPAGVYSLQRQVRLARSITLTTQGTTPESAPCGEATGRRCAEFFRAPDFSADDSLRTAEKRRANSGEFVFELTGEGVGLDHVVVNGLSSLRVKKKAAPDDGQLVSVRACSACKVSSVEVRESPYKAAVSIDESSEVTVERCSVAGGGDEISPGMGIRVRKSKSVRVVQNELKGSALFDISVSSCQGCEVSENLAWRPPVGTESAAVASIRVLSGDVAVKNNWVDCSGAGCNAAYLIGAPGKGSSERDGGSIRAANNVAFNAPFGFFFGAGPKIESSGNVAAGGTGTLACRGRGFSSFAKSSDAAVEGSSEGTEQLREARFSAKPISEAEFAKCEFRALEAEREGAALRRSGTKAAQAAVRRIFQQSMGRDPSGEELRSFTKQLLAGKSAAAAVVGRVRALGGAAAAQRASGRDGVLPIHCTKDEVCVAQSGEDGIYDGDILLPGEFSQSSEKARTKGFAIRPKTTMIWPGGVVPYTFEPSVPTAYRAPIQAAIDFYNSREVTAQTGVSFRPWQTGDSNYVSFRFQVHTWEFANSVIGMSGGLQPIIFYGPQNFRAGSGGAWTRTALHDLGHALGLRHEHQRPDRDAYIEFFPQNAAVPEELGDQIGAITQAGLQAPSVLTQGPYDFNSRMHYRTWDFSLRPNALPVFLKRGPGTIAQRTIDNQLPSYPLLSPGDIAALAFLYKPTGAAADTTRPTVSFSLLPAPSGQIRLSATFSEPVQGLFPNDFGVRGATVVSVSGSGASYIVTLGSVPTSAGSPPAVWLLGDAVSDSAGNTNSRSAEIRSSAGAPTVTTVSAQSGYYRSGSVDIKVKFSEAVFVTAGTPSLALNVVASAPYVSGSGSDELTFRYTVSSAHETFALNYLATTSLGGAAGIKDLQGQAVSGGLPDPRGPNSLDGTSNIIVSQGALPTITSTLAEEQACNGIPITISFDKAVQNFTASDLVVTNGTATNFSGSGYSYSARIVPATDGVVAVSIPAGAANNSFGGQGSLASAELRRMGRVSPVTISRVSGTDGNYQTGQQLILGVEFAEPVQFASSAMGPTQGPQRAVLRFKVETGDSDLELRATVYGSPQRTVRFMGPVNASQRSPDLGYSPGTSLQVEGQGGIVSGCGLPVSLQLPAPGTEGSLDATSSIRINQP